MLGALFSGQTSSKATDANPSHEWLGYFHSPDHGVCPVFRRGLGLLPVRLTKWLWMRLLQTGFGLEKLGSMVGKLGKTIGKLGEGPKKLGKIVGKLGAIIGKWG